MAKSICILLIALLVAPSLATAQDTLVVSLSSVMTRSLEISPEVRAKEAKTDYAEARHRLARASRFLTNFTATSAHSTAPGLDNPNGTNSEQLYLDPDVRNDWQNLSMFNRVEFSALQPLWTWGEIGKSIEAAKAGVEVEEAATLETSSQVAERAAQLYFALQYSEALSNLTIEAGEIVERALKEINRMIEEGDDGVDDADLFQVKITEQEFLQRVVEVDESRKTARAALSRLMFLPDGQTVGLESSILDRLEFLLEPLDFYQEQAISFRPELARASAGMEARLALVDVAKSHLYPKLFLGLTGRWSYAPGRERQPNPYVGDSFLSRKVEIGFGFRQNLNFVQTRAKIAQAEAESAEVGFQNDAARQLVLFEVEEAFRNVLIARSAMDSQEQKLQISKEWLRLEEVNFDLEVGDTENLVKAVKENLSIRASRQEAVYKYNVAVIKLLSKSGILIQSLEAGTLVGL
jgi:outer membrane protein